MKILQIAALYGLGESTVKRWTKGVHCPVNHRAESKRGYGDLDERRRLAKAMRAKGASIADLRAYFGIAKGTAERWVRGVRCPVNHTRLAILRDQADRRARARTMCEAGMTYKAIAAALGVKCPSTISKWCEGVARPLQLDARGFEGWNCRMRRAGLSVEERAAAIAKARAEMAQEGMRHAA